MDNRGLASYPLILKITSSVCKLFMYGWTTELDLLKVSVCNAQLTGRFGNYYCNSRFTNDNKIIYLSGYRLSDDIAI